MYKNFSFLLIFDSVWDVSGVLGPATLRFEASVAAATLGQDRLAQGRESRLNR